MVLLTITPAIVAAIQQYHSLQLDEEKHQWPESDPDIADPEVGKPISHGQIIQISKCLVASRLHEINHDTDCYEHHLDQVLRGTQIYIEPAKPKREPTPEYTALMERLRREEEAREYERMVHPSDATSDKIFAGSTSGRNSSFNQNNDSVEDEMTYADVNRQVALIINVLVSIIACSIAIWLVANGWSAPTRLALSFAGSIVVAVAEVGVYLGYLRRLKIAKGKEKRKAEKKEITSTWVIEGRKGNSSTPVQVPSATDLASKSTGVRQRKAQS